MTNLENLLQGLHAETTQHFTEQLKKANEEGEMLPPAFLSALIKFLKDNDITCELAEGTPISDLKEEISSEDMDFLRMVK
jgi:hypothetical protein